MGAEHGKKIYARVFVVVPSSSNSVALLVDRQLDVGYLLGESELSIQDITTDRVFNAYNAPNSSQNTAEAGSDDDHLDRLVLVDRKVPEGEPPILAAIEARGEGRGSVVRHDCNCRNRNVSWRR